jgi:hypothetical protein
MIQVQKCKHLRGNWNLIFLSTLSTLFFSLILSCSEQAVHRDSRGMKLTPEQRMSFSPVKKKIALLGLFNEGAYGEADIAVSATEELRYELSRTGEFVIDPMMEQIFGTSKEIYSGGGFKLIQMANKAKLSGVNFVLFGRVTQSKIREKTDEIGFVRQTQSYAECKIELRLFDINSNKEIMTENFDGYVDDSSYNFYLTDPKEKIKYRQELLRYAVRVAIRKSIPQVLAVASKLEWVGRVAKIIGTKIYINAGRNSGLQMGDILKVLTEGQEVYDPESGALIGISKGEVKGTLEIIDYFGPDGSMATLHSGGSVSEGDFVQLY